MRGEAEKRIERRRGKEGREKMKVEKKKEEEGSEMRHTLRLI